MYRWEGPQRRNAMRDYRTAKHTEAVERNARTLPERRRAFRLAQIQELILALKAEQVEQAETKAKKGRHSRWITSAHQRAAEDDRGA